MTGYEHYNVASFKEAAARWTAQGYQVETPFEANSRVWHRHYGRDFDPYKDTCEYGDPILAEMFAEDVAVLCSASGIVMLKGWQQSKGACSELLLAWNLQKAVFSDETGYALGAIPNLTFTLPNEPALSEALRIVHGNRGSDYGHPADDFARTAKMWEAILGNSVKPEQVALCMVAVKISRECNKPKRDNRVDIAGYAETLEMLHQRRAPIDSAVL